MFNYLKNPIGVKTGYFLALCKIAFAVTVFTSSANAAPPYGPGGLREAKSFAHSIFIVADSLRDHDSDFLEDIKEGQLAASFAPYLIFDSNEHHTNPFEPVTLIQVRPNGCIGYGCIDPWTITIKYAFLWGTDGGYGESSDCHDAHNGDNQSILVTVHSRDEGKTWTLDSARDVVIGDDRQVELAACFSVAGLNAGICMTKPAAYGLNFDLRAILWPNIQKPVKFPYVFFSSHKHHQYSSTWNNEKDSIYSKYGCNDDVDGNGVNKYACITPDCNDPAYIGIYNNIGEPEAHNREFFISDLSRWYPGENVWSAKEFKGGLNDDGKDTSSLLSMWMKHYYSLSNNFWSVYTARLTATW